MPCGRARGKHREKGNKACDECAFRKVRCKSASGKGPWEAWECDPPVPGASSAVSGLTEALRQVITLMTRIADAMEEANNLQRGYRREVAKMVTEPREESAEAEEEAEAEAEDGGESEDEGEQRGRKRRRVHRGKSPVTKVVEDEEAEEEE